MRAPVVLDAGRGTPAADGGTRRPLRLLTSRDKASLGGKLTSRCTWLFSPLLDQPAPRKSVADRAHDLLHPREVAVTEHAMPIRRHEHHVRLRRVRAVPDRDAGRSCRSATVRCSCAAPVRLPPRPDPGPTAGIGAGVRVRPGGVQRRRSPHAEPPGRPGPPFPTDAALSKALTAAKRTPERAWLAEVSAVVLQQALADANTAYRNFVASLKGTRKGRRLGAPRFRSRKRTARSRSASPRPPGSGAPPTVPLRLPGIGDVPVRWSRRCPPTRRR